MNCILYYLSTLMLDPRSCVPIKVEARATFTLNFDFRVCTRATAASSMGHNNIWYSRPRKSGAESHKCKAGSCGLGPIRF